MTLSSTLAYLRTQALFALSAIKLSIDLMLASWWYAPLTVRELESERLHGKVALITGSNVGIGFSTARILALHGCTVILACRDLKKANAARDAILTEIKLHHPDLWFSYGPEQVVVLPEQACDLSDLDSVRAYVLALSKLDIFTKGIKMEDDIAGRKKKIDFLVNNAGMIPHTVATSRQRFELTYATNMLGSFLLTHLLLPLMDGESGRIVQTSSAATYYAYPVGPGDLNGEKMALRAWYAEQKKGGREMEGRALGPLRSMALYGQSKAMQVIFTLSLQEKLQRAVSMQGIGVHACHPGLVSSTIWTRQELKTSLSGIFSFNYLSNLVVKWFSISAEQGALNVVWLLLADEPNQPKNRAGFWDRFSKKRLPYHVLDRKRRERVWKRWEADADLSVEERLSNRL